MNETISYFDLPRPLRWVIAIWVIAVVVAFVISVLYKEHWVARAATATAVGIFIVMVAMMSRHKPLT